MYVLKGNIPFIDLVHALLDIHIDCTVPLVPPNLSGFIILGILDRRFPPLFNISIDL